MLSFTVGQQAKTIFRLLNFRFTQQQENLSHLSNKLTLQCPYRRQRSVINVLGCSSRYFSTDSTCKSNSKVPELTSVRYPHLQRGNFSKITDDDITFFKSLLNEESRVLTNEDDCAGYNTDWNRTVRGFSKLVLRPKTTEEISKILEYCQTRNLPVCPQGGNTGMVGGSVPVFDEVVLSTQLMNKIINLYDVSGVLVCEAGCVLEVLDSYLADHDYMMPLDLGSKGSCQIGGNISTNAGGLRLLRYGSLRGSVLGIEAVLADGTIVDCMSSMRKDNTGYDLKQLFIGSEGTLGVVTKAAILCPRKPKAISVAFLGLESFAKVLATFKEAKGQLSEILSAFEFLDAHAMVLNTDNLKLSNPIGDFPFYVLIETSGSNGSHDEEKLNSFLESVMNSGLIMDGTIATELSKIQNIWQLRERLAEGLLHDGYVYKYDLSLPLPNFYQLVEVMRERLEGHVIRVAAYGHLGDGNLHLNMTSAEYSSKVAGLIEPFLYEWVSQKHGSISAEHGLGFAKNKYIHMSKSKQAVDMMIRMKKMFDPKGILNPYKTLPSPQNIQ